MRRRVSVVEGTWVTWRISIPSSLNIYLVSEEGEPPSVRAGFFGWSEEVGRETEEEEEEEDPDNTTTTRRKNAFGLC